MGLFFSFTAMIMKLNMKKASTYANIFVLQVLFLEKSKYVNEVLSLSKKWMGLNGRPLDGPWNHIVSRILPKLVCVLYLTIVHPSSEFCANWSSIALRVQVQVPSAHWLPFIYVGQIRSE